MVARVRTEWTGRKSTWQLDFGATAVRNQPLVTNEWTHLPFPKVTPKQKKAIRTKPREWLD